KRIMPLMRSCLPVWLGVLALLPAGAPAAAAEVPPWLPRYALDIHLDLAQHVAVVHEHVTWTNRHARPADELVFNAHSHFKLPDKDVGMTAKIVEILRMMPGETLDLEGNACQVQKVVLISPPSSSALGREGSAPSLRSPLRGSGVVSEGAELTRTAEKTNHSRNHAPSAPTPLPQGERGEEGYLHAPRPTPAETTELPFG